MNIHTPQDRHQPVLTARATAARLVLPCALALALALTACAPESGAAQRSDAAPTQSQDAPEAESGSTEGTKSKEEPPAQPTPAPTTEVKNPGLSQAQLDERLRGAAWEGDLPEARQLIAWGASVNAKDHTEQSAFLIAASEGRVDLARLALTHDAKINDLDSWNGTGLIRAAERGHWEVSGVLLQHEVKVNHVNRVGYQAIHEAVWFGRDDPMYHATLRVLVAGGAELTRPSVTEGLTPLQMAQQKGFPGHIAILTELAKPNPAQPRAALFAAARSGDADAAARALRAGASVASVNRHDHTAQEVAEHFGHSEVTMLLRAFAQ